MKIRKAMVKDRKFVKELDKENMTPIFKKKGIKYYGALFKPFKKCFVIEKNEKLIGFVYFDIKKKVLDIWSIQIKKTHQGKGYAKRLINYLIDFAKDKKITKIKSEADEKNKQSLAFHKKAGFKKIKKRSKKILFEKKL